MDKRNEAEYGRKCHKCGEYSCGTMDNIYEYESMDCLRRQLATANERAGRLEKQMEELRVEWRSLRGVALSNKRSVVYGAADTIDRILGGA